MSKLRLTLDALLTLDSIARAGSLAAAAQALRRVPSTISHAVHKLEQDLGVPLFERVGQHLVLTEAGEELLSGGRELLAAAQTLEARVKRVSAGWEAELRVAVDGLLPLTAFLPFIREFYRQGFPTRLSLSTEVYGGSWDALVTGRADVVIGAPGDAPPGGGYGLGPLGEVEWIFAVAPDHALARYPEPIASRDIARFRAVAAADSTRHLPARTSGLLPGQDVLTVPSLEAKVEAQCLGLGVGYLPRHRAEGEVADGRLVMKRVLEPKPPHPIWIAWRTERSGKALAWFLERTGAIRRVFQATLIPTHYS